MLSRFVNLHAGHNRISVGARTGYVHEVVNVQTAQVVSHDVMPKKEKYVFGIISRAQGELEAHISWVFLNH